jgi:hypothetical protein
LATSWLHRLLIKSRLVGKEIHHRRFLLRVESLDERVIPAVTVTFSGAGAILRVMGDAADNSIVVSRDGRGTILVNDGAIAIQGDPAPTVANTRMPATTSPSSAPGMIRLSGIPVTAETQSKDRGPGTRWCSTARTPRRSSISLPRAVACA